MNNLIGYLPPVVADIQEMQQICATETAELERYYRTIESVSDNQFVQSADKAGIERIEQSYGLKTSESNLDNRRFFILESINNFPPYSMQWLRNKLDHLLDEYTLTLKNQVLTLNVPAVYESVAFGLYRSLRKTIPAQIILRMNAEQSETAQLYVGAWMTTTDEVIL